MSFKGEDYDNRDGLDEVFNDDEDFEDDEEEEDEEDDFQKLDFRTFQTQGLYRISPNN